MSAPRPTPVSHSANELTHTTDRRDGAFTYALGKPLFLEDPRVSFGPPDTTTRSLNWADRLGPV
ncbi:MAG: hypothetical protein JWM85_344 [Acidimicrobiaceae bacterium]|nr:hypothetical protein [Acidimicrobiaceae bacterium]